MSFMYGCSMIYTIQDWNSPMILRNEHVKCEWVPIAVSYLILIIVFAYIVLIQMTNRILSSNDATLM